MAHKLPNTFVRLQVTTRIIDMSRAESALELISDLAMEGVYPEALVKHLPPEQAKYFADIKFRFFAPDMVWVEQRANQARRAGLTDWKTPGWQKWQEFTCSAEQDEGSIASWKFVHAMPYYKYGA